MKLNVVEKCILKDNILNRESQIGSLLCILGGIMNTKLSKNIPKECITPLKQIDLLSYLIQFEPNSIIKKENDYRSIIHDGLIIRLDKWEWKEKNLSGKSAIQYLVFVEMMNYSDALYLLFQCYSKKLINEEKEYETKIY